MAEPNEKLILVVDDEEDITVFLSMVLEDAGFRVETASSVDDALGKIKESQPDCISLDMVMPGKSGIVLFHAVHKNPDWRHIPVLFVTGHAKDETVKKDMDAAAVLAESTLSGPTTYLDKPVTAAKYVAAVAKAVGVELGETSKKDGGGGEVLKAQAKGLLDGADPEALKAAIELLKKRSGK